MNAGEIREVVLSILGGIAPEVDLGQVRPDADLRQALLDLATMAMYADGKLTAAEDAGVERLLTEKGFTDEYERNKDYDASISRVSRPDATAADARTSAADLEQTSRSD